MNRKAQSAMEFIMTYGWVILVILIAIAALAYFGVLDLSRFLPARCSLAPGLGCEDFTVTPDSASIAIRNGLATPVNITSLSIPTCNTTTAAILLKGEVVTLEFSDCDNGDVGDRFNQLMNISFVFETLIHQDQGEVIGIVEPPLFSGGNESDTTAPIISNINPSSGSTVSSTPFTLSAQTQESANCEYSTTSTFAYGSGTDFSVTGSTTHQSTISLSDGDYYYYIKCRDPSGNTNSNANQGSTFFTVNTPTLNLSDYGYYRQITFTEDKGIPRNNPFSFTFAHNNHVQPDCDDVIVVDSSLDEQPSNIISCGSTDVEVAVNVVLSDSQTKTYYVYYGDVDAPTPAYRSSGTEPITGRIVFTGMSISCQCGSGDKSDEVYSAIYQWLLPSGTGAIGCGSGELCNNLDVILPNIYAGTSYTYESDNAATHDLVTAGVRNYDLVITGYRWNAAGDKTQEQYNEYLRLGGHLLFTGNDLSEFTTSFLPTGYNVDIADSDLDFDAFSCATSDSSHPLGDSTFCGNWGYSCQTMNTISGTTSQKYYKVWSTGFTDPTMVVGGLDTPYPLDTTVGTEKTN